MDSDNDGVGNISEASPNDASEPADSYGDGVGDNTDNCPANSNQDQADSEKNEIRDAFGSGSVTFLKWYGSSWGQSTLE